MTRVGMWLYGFGWIFWIANMAWDNDGGQIHFVWLTLTQYFVMVPFCTFFQTIYAYLNYGSQEEVFYSWSGSKTFSAAYIVATDPVPMYRFLMWRDVNSVAVPSGSYDLLSNLKSRAYDTKAQISFYSSLATILGFFVLIGFSYVPFYFDYTEKKFENDIELAQEYWDNNGSKWDEYGCDAYGLDIDDNPC